jgi:hypothetical protein
MPSTTRAIVTGLVLIALGMTGCTTYYQITDPASGRRYYTDDIKRRDDGTVQFKDLKSGAEVTLRSSEIREVSGEDAKKGTAR